MKLKIILVSMLSSMLVSCITLPTSNLNIDFSDQTIPIMLSKPEDERMSKEIDLSSGYQSVSVYLAFSLNGRAVSATATIGQDMNLPIRMQLNNYLINNPSYIQLSQYKLKIERFDRIGYRKLNYLSSYTFNLPSEEAQK